MMTADYSLTNINNRVVQIATGYTFHKLSMQLAHTSPYNTQTLYQHWEHTFY